MWKILIKSSVAKAFLTTVLITGAFGAVTSAIWGAIYTFPYSFVGVFFGLGSGARGGFIAGLIGFSLRGRAGWIVGGMVGGLYAWGYFPAQRFYSVWHCIAFFAPVLFGAVCGLATGSNERGDWPFAEPQDSPFQWQSSKSQKLRFILIGLLVTFSIANVRNTIRQAHWDKFDERDMLIDVYASSLNNPEQGRGNGFRIAKGQRIMIYNKRAQTLSDSYTRSTWSGVTDATLEKVVAIDGTLEQLSLFGAAGHKSSVKHKNKGRSG